MSENAQQRSRTTRERRSLSASKKPTAKVSRTRSAGNRPSLTAVENTILSSSAVVVKEEENVDDVFDDPPSAVKVEPKTSDEGAEEPKPENRRRSSRVIPRRTPKVAAVTPVSHWKQPSLSVEDAPEDAAQSQFNIGDLVWGHGTHPYWPAIICLPPFDAKHAEPQQHYRYDRRQGYTKVIYHLLYLADGTHNWVNGASTKVYEGLEKLIEECPSVTSVANKTDETRQFKLYVVPKHNLSARNDAVAMADQLMELKLDASTPDITRLDYLHWEKVGKLLRVAPPDDTSLTRLSSVPLVVPSRKRKHEPTTKSVKRVKTQKQPAAPSSPSETVEKTTEGEDEVEDQTIKSILPKTDVCFECEDTIDVGAPVACNGQCGRSYHGKCLSTDGQCSACAKGESPSCRICLQHDKHHKMHRCDQDCESTYFHPNCVAEHVVGFGDAKRRGENVCPMHTCLTCALDADKHHKMHKGAMLRCVRCPRAYHRQTACIPAGATLINDVYLVCPEHMVRKGPEMTLNLNECFVCNMGGDLICCETCPTALHDTEDCRPGETHGGSAVYICPLCTAGKHPTFGELLFVKMGAQKLWPAIALSPFDVPQNFKMPLYGYFHVKFFGVAKHNEYGKTHKGRCYTYSPQTDAHLKPADRSNPSYMAAITEANAMYKVRDDADHAAIAKVKQEQVLRQPKHLTLKVNKYMDVSRNAVKVEDDPPACVCVADSPCHSTDCLNRVVFIECTDKICPLGVDECQNRRFTKRQYVLLKRVKTANRGFGMVTMEDVAKGGFVIEYVGQVISKAECKKRLDEMRAKGNIAFYFMDLDAVRVIDAGPAGNEARFINHSCAPNCKTVIWSVGNEKRVGVFAIDDIKAGTEITFNYQWDNATHERCMCGAPTCTGALNAPNDDRPSAERKLEKKKRPSRSARQTSSTSRSSTTPPPVMCVACKTDVLLTSDAKKCGMQGCGKVYHKACSAKAGKQTGGTTRNSWRCAQHFCRVCVQSATVECPECTGGWCATHFKGEATEDVKPNVHGVVHILCAMHPQ